MRDSATRSSVERRARSQLHHKPQVTKYNSFIRRYDVLQHLVSRTGKHLFEVCGHYGNKYKCKCNELEYTHSSVTIVKTDSISREILLRT